MLRTGWVVWFGVWSLAACTGGAPATQEQIALHTSRLLAPYVAGGEVGCQELQIDVSSNLQGNVSQPAIDVNLHDAFKEDGDGWHDTVWTNKAGDLAGLFVVAIGEQDRFTDKGHELGRCMKFTVTNRVRIRVHTAGPMRLDVQAKGDVLVYRPADADATDVHEFSIQDGVLHRR